LPTVAGAKRRKTHVTVGDGVEDILLTATDSGRRQ
jgi:hypothetical protein